MNIEFRDEIIQEISTVNNGITANKWLRSAEVREMLNISTGTLQNMRINGTIPFSKLGPTIFYDWNTIEDILEGNKTA